MHKDCGPTAISNAIFVDNAVSTGNEEIQHAATQVRLPDQNLMAISISRPVENHHMLEDKVQKRYGSYELNDGRSFSQKRRNDCSSICGCAKAFKDNRDERDSNEFEGAIESSNLTSSSDCANQMPNGDRVDRLPRRTSNRKAQQPRRNYNGVIQLTPIRIQNVVLNQSSRKSEEMSSQKRQVDETYKGNEASMVQEDAARYHAAAANSTAHGFPKDIKRMMPANQIEKRTRTIRANASNWMTANKIQEGAGVASLRNYGRNRGDQMQYTILQDSSHLWDDNEIERGCDALGIYMQQCSPSQLHLLWANRILPMGTVHCTLITQANAERLCHQLLFPHSSADCPMGVPILDDQEEIEPRSANTLTTQGVANATEDKVAQEDRKKWYESASHKEEESGKGRDAVFSDTHLPVKEQTSQISGHPELTNNLAIYAGCCTFVPVAHNCSSYIRGLAFLTLYRSVQSACIQCRHCNKFYTPQDFVCHEHKNASFAHNKRRNSIPRQRGPSVCHWGLDSNKWRAYLDVDKSYADTVSNTYASPDDKINVARTLICLWQRRLDGMKKIFAGIAEYYDQSTGNNKSMDTLLTEELRGRKDFHFSDMFFKLPLLTVPATYNPALCMPPFLAPLMLNGRYGSGIATKRPQRFAATPSSDYATLNPGVMALDIGFDALHRSISRATSKDSECARMINEDLARLRLLCQHSTSYLLQTNSLLSQSVDRLAQENSIMRKELNRFASMQAASVMTEMDEKSFADARRTSRDATSENVLMQWKESNHVK